MKDEELYEKVYYLIKYTVNQYRGSYHDIEELESIANIAFVECLPLIDKTKKYNEITKFITNRIKWSINQELRKHRASKRDYKKKVSIDNCLSDENNNERKETLIDVMPVYDSIDFINEQEIKKILLKIFKNEDYVELYYDYNTVNRMSKESEHGLAINKRYNEVLAKEFGYETNQKLARKINDLKNRILKSEHRNELYEYLKIQ